MGIYSQTGIKTANVLRHGTLELKRLHPISRYRQAFNFGVIWDGIDSSIYIDTSIDYVP